MIEIEKGIPIPKTWLRSGGANSVYPFAKMQIGDSFFVDEQHWASAQSLASRYGRKHGVTMATRRIDGGLRIWRIK